MNYGRKKIAILAGAFWLAVLLTGCSGEASNNDGAVASGIIQSEPQVFPLDEFIGDFWSSEFLDEEERRQQEADIRFRRDYITQCMHQAGFAFNPDLLPGDLMLSNIVETPIATPELWRRNDRDWIAQWGYAIVNRPEDLSVNTGDFNTDDHGMSEAELVAFTRALTGSLFEPSEGGSGTVGDLFRDGGCWGAAELALSETQPRGALWTDEFRPLLLAMNAMNEELSDEITDAEREWSACMADAGFPGLTDRWAAQDQIIRSQSVIWNMPGAILPADRTVDNWPELRDLFDREIETALADYDCRIEVNFQARQDARRIERETQFVTDHRTELEALRAAAEQRG